MAIKQAIHCIMTGHYTFADERCQIDLAWQEKREQFLEDGREPRPLDGQSIALILAFFALAWGLSTWVGLTQLIPAISAVTIVGFASLRFRSFERAYLDYLQARAAATVPVS